MPSWCRWRRWRAWCILSGRSRAPTPGWRDVFVSELFRIVDGREGKDLLRGHEASLTVRESDTLQSALEKMLDYQEDILPVVDSGEPLHEADYATAGRQRGGDP